MPNLKAKRDAQVAQVESALKNCAAELVERALAHFKENPPPKTTPRGLRDILGSRVVAHDDLWTTEDEERLQDDCASREDAFAAVKGSKQLLTAWKSCIQSMRCSPLAIISPRHSLFVGQETAPARGQNRATTEGLLWPQNLYTELVTLVSSPIWLGEPLALSAAIQFAVICRTDERRPWRMPCVTSCQGMEALKRRAMRPLDVSPSDTLEEIADNVEEAGNGLSVMFQLLRSIGQSVGSGSALGRAEGPVKYEVTVQDLKSIRGAIDSLRIGSAAPVVLPTSVSEALAKLGRASCPPSSAELVDFHRRSWLHERRLATRDSRERQSGSAGSLPRSESHGSQDEQSEPSSDPFDGEQLHLSPNVPSRRRESDSAEVSLGSNDDMLSDDSDESADVDQDGAQSDEEGDGALTRQRRAKRRRADSEEHDASPTRQRQGKRDRRDPVSESPHVSDSQPEN
ncbi:hypothetical protein PLIIFM63780_003381 [Purpureocillium lilacinum]|nr:hypothetical protein PLIIFM63780_003381 [Purpureocillium lilacinum]